MPVNYKFYLSKFIFNDIFSLFNCGPEGQNKDVDCYYFMLNKLENPALPEN